MPKYILFTGSPPFCSGGGGCNILTHDLLKVLGPDCPVACLPSNSNEEARKQAATTVYFRELRGKAYRRFLPRSRRIADSMAAYIAGVCARRTLRDAKVDTVFAFAGADWRFLYQASAFSRGAGIPFDLYVVDDFEESEIGWAPGVDIESLRKIEVATMRKAKKVYCISKGYCEHLHGKYGVDSTHLPILLRPSEYVEVQGAPERKLVFYGSVNRLYTTALECVVEVLDKVNRLNLGYLYRLLVISNSPLQGRLSDAESRGVLQRVSGLGIGEIAALSRTGWANILPYAFEKSEEVMVSTSFPTKFTNCAQSGRPTIVFAPPYSSTFRYGYSNGWRWLAESPEQLVELLSSEGESSGCEWQRQRETFLSCNSCATIRRVLGV